MIRILFLFLFCTTSLLAQPPLSNEKWGTIKVKKIESDKKALPVIKKKAPAKPSTRIFFVRMDGRNYKETFPAAYQSKLFPLVFNGSGLILTDDKKQWSSNTILGFDYNFFVGNATAFNAKSATTIDLNHCIQLLTRGQFLWIKGLYYADSNGIIHRDEIGEFKVERLN